MNKIVRISKIQLFFFIIQVQMGIGVLSLAYNVYKVAKNDGWISVIISGVMIQLILLVFYYVLKSHPNSTIFDIVKRVFGKYLGLIINIVIVLFLISTAILIGLLYVKLYTSWLTPNTPRWVLLILLIFVSIYVTKENIKVISRVFFISSIPILFLIYLTLFSIEDTNYLYLFPINNAGVINILKGSHEVIISMLGFELILIISPFVNANIKQQFKVLTLSNLVITIAYTLVMILCITYFSPDEIKLVPEPLLYLIKAETFSIISRIDIIFLSIWTILITTSFTGYFYGASIGIQKILKLKSHENITPILGVLILILTIILNSPKFLTNFNLYVSYSSYVIIALVPILISILTLIRRVRKNESN